MVKITRTNYKVKTDKRGRYIKIGSRKYYLNFLKIHKSGLTEREFIQWLLKRLIPKRRRKTRQSDARKATSKVYSNVPIVGPIMSTTQAVYDAEKLRGQIAREKAKAENLTKDYVKFIEQKALKLDETPLLTHEQTKTDKKHVFDKSTRDGLFSNLQKLEATKNQLEQTNRQLEQTTKMTEDKLKEKQSKLEQFDKRSKDAARDFVTKMIKLEYKKGHVEELRKMAADAQIETQKTAIVPKGKKKGQARSVPKNSAELIEELLKHGDNEFTKIIQERANNEYQQLQMEEPQKEAPKIEEVEEDEEDEEDDGFESLNAGKVQGKGLWNDELDKIMSKNPSYIGTVSSDKIRSLLPKIRSFWRANKHFGFITNTLSSNAGHKLGHWVAIFIKPNDSISYYDSFGEPAPVDIKKHLKFIMDQVKPTSLIKFKENLIKQQSITTANCGWFAAKFLKDMFSGKPFIDTTGFSRVVKSEKEIEKFKKKFKPFGWL